MTFGTLIISYPSGREEIVGLTKPIYSLGSADDNDLVLRDGTVEAHHAQLLCDDDSCEVVDLGSASGTWLGSVRLHPQVHEPLRDQALIRVGQVDLIYRLQALAASPPADESVKQLGRRWGRRSQGATTTRQWPRQALLWTEAILLVVFALLVGGWFLYPHLGTGLPRLIDAPRGSSPAAGPTAIPAQAQGSLYVVATAGNLRLTVRNAPDLNAPVVGQLTNGTAVRVIEGPVVGGNFNWVHIASDEISGWCVQEGLRPR